MITEILPQSNSALKLERIHHSCAHVLAMAAQSLYPETKVTISSVIEIGFYYYFDRPLNPMILRLFVLQAHYVILKTLTSIKRSGASLILTYFAKQVAQQLSQN